ncbi:hypothetical protein AB0H76_37730 [Nocardia sp. NPDC050712]|uniref:hypothetical protein n=1 Tax=Nocardia sp. NPDC050712 TaxID=3155518 RepID=UPI00340966C2
MSTILPALIAVAGTLLGAGATFFFQRSTAERAATLGFAERLRQDRLNAYNAFADAAAEYRGAEFDRWFRIQENDSAAVRAALQAAHAKRTVARSALLRIALLTDDSRLRELGQEIIELSRLISRAADATERDSKGDRARELLDAFVERAATQVQAPAAVTRRATRQRPALPS